VFCRKAPTDDGGAELTGYVIERKEDDDDFWTTLPDVVSGTSHTVKGLKKGKKYKFRVRAENIYGLSDPVETDKSVLAKNPYGTPVITTLARVTVPPSTDRSVVFTRWRQSTIRFSRPTCVRPSNGISRSV